MRSFAGRYKCIQDGAEDIYEDRTKEKVAMSAITWSVVGLEKSVINREIEKSLMMKMNEK